MIKTDYQSPKDKKQGKGLVGTEFGNSCITEKWKKKKKKKNEKAFLAGCLQNLAAQIIWRQTPPQKR